MAKNTHIGVMCSHRSRAPNAREHSFVPCCVAGLELVGEKKATYYITHRLRGPRQPEPEYPGLRFQLFRLFGNLTSELEFHPSSGAATTDRRSVETESAR